MSHNGSVREHIDFKATLHRKSGKSKLVTCKERIKFSTLNMLQEHLGVMKKNSLEVYVADS